MWVGIRWTAFATPRCRASFWRTAPFGRPLSQEAAITSWRLAGALSSTCMTLQRLRCDLSCCLPYLCACVYAVYVCVCKCDGVRVRVCVCVCVCALARACVYLRGGALVTAGVKVVWRLMRVLGGELVCVWLYNC
jgi:hypothetical protein